LTSGRSTFGFRTSLKPSVGVMRRDDLSHEDAPGRSDETARAGEAIMAEMTKWAAVRCAAVLLALVAAAAAGAGLPGCGEETGVCTACCGPSGRTYCKDGWSESECEDWSKQKVNGLSWTFHGGQTCEGRGTPATP
jgi:hypothetical protein